MLTPRLITLAAACAAGAALAQTAAVEINCRTAAACRAEAQKLLAVPARDVPAN
jgi:hypothetical protein